MLFESNCHGYFIAMYTPNKYGDPQFFLQISTCYEPNFDLNMKKEQVYYNFATTEIHLKSHFLRKYSSD